jgi:predicted SnoaL-like aldol condensation-catalyzing enzyme
VFQKNNPLLSKKQETTMSFKRTVLLSAALAATVGLAACSTIASDAKPTPMSKATAPMSNAKQQVVDLLKSIETGEAAPAAIINPGKYIQHNLAVSDGLAGFGKVLQALPKGSAKANTVRVFQDGPFVFAHTDYNFFGPKIGFDIFRFEDGKIVEHWDNLQDTPTQPNPSGHTMIDGPTVATDLDKTEANKALVKAFVDDVFVNGREDKRASYFDGDNYIQHNRRVPDGLSSLTTMMQTMAKAGVRMTFTKVHKILGEGNFVLTVSEGKFGGKHVAFYDLYRVQAGKIAEHWDTMQEIPAKADWKNSNGKFNF